MKTIAIPERVHEKLIYLKLEKKKKNIAEIIDRLIEEHKENVFRQECELFRKRLAKKGDTLFDLLKKSRKIREEIANEWF